MTNKSRVLVGSLTRHTPYFKQAHGEGITVFDFDEERGILRRQFCQTGIDNPTFIASSKDCRHIYVTSEVFGWNEGTLSAYALTAEGKLSYINKQVARGSITTHSGVDRSGRYAFAVNYAHETWEGYGPDVPGQAVAVFPIRDDGGLDPAISTVAHQGSGPVPDRQTWPHPHCAVASPDNRFVIVTDLGADRIISYRFDQGKLSRAGAPTPLVLQPGAGPRHFIFAKGGDRAYVINELNGTIVYLGYDPATGALDPRQTISTLPPSHTTLNNCADVHLSPDERFLYGSNRGHDSIACFSVDPQSGRLSSLGQVPTGGQWPRNFALSASGRYLLVANQNSDNITVFRRDEEHGSLTQIDSVAIGTPMVVAVFPV
jgi:6-phosphogluconolactonase